LNLEMNIPELQAGICATFRATQVIKYQLYRI